MSLWQRMKSKLIGTPPPPPAPPPVVPPSPPSRPPETETSVRKNKPSETGRRATRTRSKEPKDAAGWVERAIELLRAGESEKAVAGFTRAIELDANLAKAYAGRGVAFEALGRQEEAKADYKTSIGIELRGVLKAEYGYEKKD